MAVKLIDLQLIYGVAGAREKFEDLVAKLIKRERKGAEKVRTKRGDDGLDVYVGELTDEKGIDVYQCKFFPQGIGKSQKTQIRKSFKRCLRSKKFKTRSWTLCLPLDLTPEERTWFKDWRTKQTSVGIAIGDPWTAIKLVTLLYLGKNRGLKEAFFKEEYLAQIRGLHRMMVNLLPDIAERLRQVTSEREQAQRTDAISRQDKYIHDCVVSLRQEYIGIKKGQRPPWSEVQREKQTPGNGNEPHVIRSRWEILIHPSWVPDAPQMESLGEARRVIADCQLGPDTGRFPEINAAERTSGLDWVGGKVAIQPDIECWRFSQRYVFAYMLTMMGGAWSFGPTRSSYVEVEEAIGKLTQIFRFAGRLAERAFPSGDGTVDVTITWTKTKGRVIVPPTIGLYSFAATEAELKNTWHCPRSNLLATPDSWAVTAGTWFFERFNWHSISREIVGGYQAKILRHIS